MEKTPHVMLAGEGAARFADDHGCDEIDDVNAWFTRAGQGEDNHPPGELAHGTVGCVVLDADGRMAAITSTAGVFGKLPGRVGDTPIIGSGCWCDEGVAVSAHRPGRVLHADRRRPPRSAGAWRPGRTSRRPSPAVLEEIGAMGGDGGLIALDREGRIATLYNSEGMKRALLTPAGDIRSERVRRLIAVLRRPIACAGPADA